MEIRTYPHFSVYLRAESSFVVAAIVGEVIGNNIDNHFDIIFFRLCTKFSQFSRSSQPAFIITGYSESQRLIQFPPLSGHITVYCAFILVIFRWLNRGSLYGGIACCSDFRQIGFDIVE